MYADAAYGMIPYPSTLVQEIPLFTLILSALCCFCTPIALCACCLLGLCFANVYVVVCANSHHTSLLLLQFLWILNFDAFLGCNLHPHVVCDATFLGCNVRPHIVCNLHPLMCCSLYHFCPFSPLCTHYHGKLCFFSDLLFCSANKRFRGTRKLLLLISCWYCFVYANNRLLIVLVGKRLRNAPICWTRLDALCFSVPRLATHPRSICGSSFGNRFASRRFVF